MPQEYTEALLIVPSHVEVGRHGSKVTVVPIIPTSEFRRNGLVSEASVLVKNEEQWSRIHGIATRFDSHWRTGAISVAEDEGELVRGQQEPDLRLLLTPEGYSARQFDYSSPVKSQPMDVITKGNSEIPTSEMAFIPSNAFQDYKPAIITLPDGTQVHIKRELGADRYSFEFDGERGIRLDEGHPTQFGDVTLIHIPSRGVILDNNNKGKSVLVEGLVPADVDPEYLWGHQNRRDSSYFTNPWEIGYGPIQDGVYGASDIETYKWFKSRVAELGLTQIENGRFILADGVKYVGYDGTVNSIPSAWEFDPKYINIPSRENPVGVYLEHGGIITFISPEGQRMIGIATAENLQALEQAKYNRDGRTLTVPMSQGGERFLHPQLAWELRNAKIAAAASKPASRL